MSESSFSKRIKNKLRKEGFFVLDLESLGEGIPDCLVIDRKNNKCCFIEFKMENGKLTKAQVIFFLKEKGILAMIYYSDSVFKVFLRNLQEKMK
jgi:hypothetical protein